MKIVTEYGTWTAVDGNAGGAVIPSDVIDPPKSEIHSDDPGGAKALKPYFKYYEGNELFSAEPATGWFVHETEPGYMDQTEWMGPYESEKEAIKAYREQYGLDKDDDGLEGVRQAAFLGMTHMKF